MERRTVEHLSGQIPRVRGEAEAVPEPEVVETEVGKIAGGLGAEERAKRKALRHSLGVGGVAAGVGVHGRRGIEHAKRVESRACAEFGVTPVFEIRLRKLGAEVEHRADGDRHSRKGFHALLLERRDHTLENPVGHDWRVFAIQDAPFVKRAPRWIVLPLRRTVCSAEILAPLERRVKVARVVENFAAIRGENQDRDGLARF